MIKTPSRPHTAHDSGPYKMYIITSIVIWSRLTGFRLILNPDWDVDSAIDWTKMEKYSWKKLRKCSSSKQDIYKPSSSYQQSIVPDPRTNWNGSNLDPAHYVIIYTFLTRKIKSTYVWRFFCSDPFFLFGEQAELEFNLAAKIGQFVILRHV